ncbi:MAG: hypoxanthine phosphoribosyltransferase [Lachnospiraceae bacterium]|nr:hypoxanthine phosphoribosyltransferase [Lachnospiraceae bacterium]
MSKNIRVLLPEEEIAQRIAQMGQQITEDYKGESVFLVCTLRGSCFFACDLAKRIDLPLTLDFVKASSYGSGTASSGKVKFDLDVELSMEGRHVIIVDDIVDSGHTLQALLSLFKDRGAKSVRVATLLDKPDRREVDVAVDYVGFAVPNLFVIGYGLDFDQKYRNLPYIGVLESD